MKNKAYLLILEQLCMVLFFSLIAVMTLRTFSEAQDISIRKSALESAMVVTQNTAEMLKSTGGDFAYTAEKMSGTFEEGRLILYCDRNARPIAAADRAHREVLEVFAEPLRPENSLLDGAHIRAVWGDTIILEFDVCWQRGDSNEK